MPITRDGIIAAVRAAVEPLDWVRALVVGGSESFGRVDHWSDVDLGLFVEDARIADGFATIEAALQSVAPIERTLEINLVSHEKPQRMYQLLGADPYLQVDVAVLLASLPFEKRFIGRRRHGATRVLFDRDGLTRDQPPDPAHWRERLRRRVGELRAWFEMMQALPVKSARRGEACEAVAFYHAFTLRPLVEALRIVHDPWRHDFGVRYLRFDLPPDVAARVYALSFVRDLDDLLAKRDEAEAWFREVMAGIDVDAIPLD